MLVTPFIAYQLAFRFVCSPRRHHIVVMATNVGARGRVLVYKSRQVWVLGYKEHIEQGFSVRTD